MTTDPYIFFPFGTFIEEKVTRKEKIKHNCLDMKVRISMENNLHNFDHIQVFYAR